MFSLIVCILLLIISFIYVDGRISTDVDYSFFRAAVHNISQQQVIPMTLASTPDDCHFPPSSVMFTYTSHYMVDLMRIQNQALKAAGMGECLSRRFIRVCVDKPCHEFCRSLQIPYCIFIDFKTILPPSDFLVGEYFFFTFLKHILMNEALKVVEHVFFIDADAILMRNPFPETQFARNEQGVHQVIDTPFDFMFQRGRGRGGDCWGSVNSGQVYLYRTPKMRVFLQEMFKRQDIILNGTKGLDQDFMIPAAKVAKLSYCVLTPSLYSSHCHQRISRTYHGHVSVTSLISYHAACLQGVVTKGQAMTRVLQAIERRNMSHITDIL